MGDLTPAFPYSVWCRTRAFKMGWPDAHRNKTNPDVRVANENGSRRSRSPEEAGIFDLLNLAPTGSEGRSKQRNPQQRQHVRLRNGRDSAERQINAGSAHV